MVPNQIFTMRQMLLTEVVVDAGLCIFALLTYRFFLAALLVVPLAIIFERGGHSPSVSTLSGHTGNYCYHTYCTRSADVKKQCRITSLLSVVALDINIKLVACFHCRGCPSLLLLLEITL